MGICIAGEKMWALKTCTKGSLMCLSRPLRQRKALQLIYLTQPTLSSPMLFWLSSIKSSSSTTNLQRSMHEHHHLLLLNCNNLLIKHIINHHVCCKIKTNPFVLLLVFGFLVPSLFIMNKVTLSRKPNYQVVKIDDWTLAQFTIRFDTLEILLRDHWFESYKVIDDCTGCSSSSLGLTVVCASLL